MATRNWDACNYQIIDCSHFRMNAYTTKCIITSYFWDVQEIQYRLYHPAIKWNNQQQEVSSAWEGCQSTAN